MFKQRQKQGARNWSIKNSKSQMSIEANYVTSARKFVNSKNCHVACYTTHVL